MGYRPDDRHRSGGDLIVRLSSYTKRRNFHDACDRASTTATDAVRQFIDQFIDDHASAEPEPAQLDLFVQR